MIKENDMEFNPDKVTKIYLGKDRNCRCGCGGEYVYRGEPKFESRLKTFTRKLVDYTPGKHDVDSNYINVSYGNNRALTVYF